MTTTARRLATATGAIAITLALAPPAPGQPAERALVTGEVILVAGSGDGGYSGDGWDARDARLGSLLSVHVAPNGTVYLADTNNGRLRAVTAEGVIDTVPGTRPPHSPENNPADDPDNGALLGPRNRPFAAAVAADGTLYVASRRGILRGGPDGTFTVVAGAGELRYFDGTGGDGGPATEAQIDEPTDIAIGPTGDVYVADTHNHRIRRIDQSGTISTVAGGGDLAPQTSDGQPATAAKLAGPTSLAVDSRGTVYFKEGANSFKEGATVRQVAPDGTITTVVGNAGYGFAGDGGPAAEARVGEHLGGIAVDAEDNLYLLDSDNGQVRMVDPDGIISTVTPAISGEDIAVGPDGDLYVTGGNQVHRLVRHGTTEPAPMQPAGESRWADEDPGTVITVAGTERELPVEERDSHFRGDPEPPPGPSGIAAGPDGTVYYADAGRNEVGAVAPDGTVTVLVGEGEGGPLNAPSGVAPHPVGGVYVADSENNLIRRIEADGTTTTVAGSFDYVSGETGDGGPANRATLSRPQDLAVDAAGNLYVTSASGGRVRKIDTAGVITRVAGGGERYADEADSHPAIEADLRPGDPVAVDAAGTVYFAEQGHPAVRAISPDGVLSTIAGDSHLDQNQGGFAGDGGPATQAEINTPGGLAMGPDGALYVADTYNNRVRKIDPNGVITTIAGTGERADRGDDAPATDAALTEPSSVTFDPEGNLYVASTASGRIRKIDPNGTITTVTDLRAAAAGDAGSGDAGSGDGGAATDAILVGPHDLSLDPAGTLYVAEVGSTRAVDTNGRITSLDEDESASALASAPDGSLYLAKGVGKAAEVVRRHPGGPDVTVAGGGPIEEPFADGELATTTMFTVSAVATGPDGAVYLASSSRVYRLGRDGRLTELMKGSMGGLAAGRDGVVYVVYTEQNRVLRIDGDTVTPFAGTLEKYPSGGDNGDGGPATEAALDNPTDIAVDRDGTVYVSGTDGIRRVDAEGEIDTVVPPTTVSRGDVTVTHAPGALAFDTHGDLYFVEPTRNVVRVVVRPGEHSGPFPWIAVWLGAAAVVVAAGALAYLAYRRTLPGFLAVRRQPTR